jgi:hypothetical protein
MPLVIGNDGNPPDLMTVVSFHVFAGVVNISFTPCCWLGSSTKSHFHPRQAPAFSTAKLPARGVLLPLLCVFLVPVVWHEVTDWRSAPREDFPSDAIEGSFRTNRLAGGKSSLGADLQSVTSCQTTGTRNTQRSGRRTPRAGSFAVEKAGACRGWKCDLVDDPSQQQGVKEMLTTPANTWKDTTVIRSGGFPSLPITSGIQWRKNVLSRADIGSLSDRPSRTAQFTLLIF